jgi:hypothetical protein
MKNKYNQYGGYIDINDYKTYGSYISSSEYYKEIYLNFDNELGETKEEKEIRLAKEKAETRNNKIDQILGE